MRRLSSIPLVLLGAWATTTCSGGSGDGGTPPPVAVATVGVTPAGATLAVGEATQLTATTRDASGNALTGRSVAWTSGASGVASVSSSGLVTAVGPGQAMITATSEGKSAS